MMNTLARVLVRQRSMKFPVALTPPDPEGAAVSLADGVQKSMAAMYSLHTALVNARAQSNASPKLLNGYKEHMESFKISWNSIIEFLQQCHGYAEDYVSLCDYAVRRPPAECLPFFKDILALAKSTCEQAGVVQVRHENVYKELLLRKKKFSSALGEVEASGQTVVATEKSNGKMEGTLDRFIRVARSALYPDGGSSLSETYAALNETQKALEDLASFWSDHLNHLIATSTSRNVSVFLPIEELTKSRDAWKRYQSTVRAVISSISASADALTVSSTARTPRSAHGRQRRQRKSRVYSVGARMHRREKLRHRPTWEQVKMSWSDSFTRCGSTPKQTSARMSTHVVNPVGGKPIVRPCTRA